MLLFWAAQINFLVNQLIDGLSKSYIHHIYASLTLKKKVMVWIRQGRFMCSDIVLDAWMLLAQSVQ